MADDALSKLRNQYGITPPEQPAGGDALSRLNAQYGTSRPASAPQDDGMGLGARVGQAGLRTLQTVNRFVKPIFLPQEILFSTIAGARDEETTIFERLRNVDWADFVPGTETHPELTSGEELLSLFGVENEQVLKWGGLSLELFADPLLAGATARWAGKGLKSAELISLGDKLDEISSIGGLYRSSGPVKGWVDKRVDVVLRQVRDNETGRPFGIRSDLVRKAADATLPRTQAARLRLGEPGREVVVARELGTQRAKDVFEEAYSKMVDANETLFGEPPRSWLKRVMGGIQRGAEASNEFVQLNQKMRDGLLKMAYDFTDSNGFLFTRGIKEADEIASRIVSPEKLEAAKGTFAELQEKVRALAKREGLGDTAADNLVSRFSKFTQQVSEADAYLGYQLSGYEHVQKKFMAQTMKALGDEADTALASEVWLEFLSRASRESTTDATRLDFDEIVQFVKHRGKAPPGMKAEVRIGQVNTKTGEFRPDKVMGTPTTADRFKFTQPQLPGDTGTGRSVANILEGEHLFSSLNITSYIKGLANGHMRRAYGMFIDTDNFDRYIRTVKEGKIIPNNILKDVDIERALGEGAELESKAIRDYLEAVTGTKPGDLAKAPKGRLNGSQTPRGFVIHKHNLATSIIEDLTKQGVGKREAAKRARDALLRIQEEMNPSMRPVIKEIQDISDRFEGNLKGIRDAADTFSANQRGRPGTFGRKFFDARDEIDQEMLEKLGEFMNPLVSLQETVSAARVRMPAQEFMRRAYHIARENGLVSDTEKRVNGVNFRKIKDPETVYGAFSEKYIHPGLREEIERVITSRGDKALGLQRMRAIISGGYLASPNVVSTNLIGGITTAALIGVNPGRMMRALSETLRPLLRNQGKDYDVFQELTQHTAVQETSAVTQNFADAFEKTRLREVGMGLTDVEKGLHGIRDFFEGQLRSPLGAWWAGLDGFQFVEKWLKTATFKTERDRLITKYGGAAGSEGYARAVKEAAEMARISVFDYSELPDLLKFARDYGIIMFPGFTYFMAGRAANSLMNRPGAFALADRMSEAVTSANLDPEEKMVAYHSMPQWLKDEQGAVVRTYEAEDGSKRAVAIPLAQMIPTNTQFGGVFAESLGTGGIWKPFAEMLTAFTFADGEAVFSRHFGGQVYSPDARGMEKVSQAGKFLYNSLAPSALRKLVRPSDGTAEGVIPSIWKSAIPVDNEFADGMYSFQELKTRIPDRRIEDELISTFIRSTQTIGLGGGLNGVRKQLDREKMQLQAALGALKRRYEQAVVEGNQGRVEQLRQEIVGRRQEFMDKWKPIMEQYRQLADRNSRI